MCNHDIDIDLISFFFAYHMCVCVCGAEPVSSVILYWEENERTIVNVCIEVCIHKRRERESESSKKCNKSRFVC